MGVYFLLLVFLGLAITARAQDCSRPVGGPNMSLKDEFILLDTFPDGTTVSFVCNSGYITESGTSSITCTAGVWSALTLKCERRSCGSLGDLPNGHVDYSGGSLFGDTVTVHCDIGYILVGRDKISCGAAGWLHRLPICDVVKCDPPPTFVNGNFEPDNDIYEYGDVVLYKCKKDFQLNGTRSLVCSENGTFTPSPPICTKVNCEDPVIENTLPAEGSRPPHGYLATVTFECKSGYTMIGSATQQCDINSVWIPGLPRCQRTTTTTTTTKKPTTTTTTKKPATTTIEGTETTPDSGGYKWQTSLGIAFGVLIGIAVLIICGCYCFGVPALIRKKRKQCSTKCYSDNETTKAEEGVTLS